MPADWLLRVLALVFTVHKKRRFLLIIAAKIYLLGINFGAVGFMKALIVCFSYHHKNTLKIASVLANAIDAEVKTPSEADPNSLSSYDLVGFGSGIYYGRHGNALLEFVDKLPQATNKKAFIFSTSGQKKGAVTRLHLRLKERLGSKGFDIVGEFNCPGLDTYGPFKIVGGINKGRPNGDDLKRAKEFAQSLKVKIT